jgi:hypothetical protein
MDVDTSLARFGLVPKDSDMEEIRSLLRKEADAERQGRPRTDDLALLCCVQLFSRGYPEDSLSIWDAKRSGMDLGCYLDVQFLCGAGLPETKAFLAAQPTEAAATALRYLVECEAAGDFVGFSPSGHLQHYRAYFGVA